MEKFWAWMLDNEELTVGQFILRALAVVGVGLCIIVPIVLILVIITILHVWILFLITIGVLLVSGLIGFFIIVAVSEYRINKKATR